MRRLDGCAVSLVVIGLCIGLAALQLASPSGRENLGTVAIGLAAVGAVWQGWKLWRWYARRDYLRQKYRDESIVEALMNGRVWQGQTVEMLTDALGRPARVEEKVLKTKTKHTYKYHQTGANRFATRVTVENGLVVGWEFK